MLEIIDPGGVPGEIIEMTWDAVCSEFGSMHLNWDPTALPNRITRHWWVSNAGEEIFYTCGRISNRLEVRQADKQTGHGQSPIQTKARLVSALLNLSGSACQYPD